MAASHPPLPKRLGAQENIRSYWPVQTSTWFRSIVRIHDLRRLRGFDGYQCGSLRSRPILRMVIRLRAAVLMRGMF